MLPIRLLQLVRIYHQQNDPGAPGGAPPIDPPAPTDPPVPPTDPPAPPAPPAPPQTFTQEYVQKLRAESAGYRTKLQEAVKKGELTDSSMKEIARIMGLGEGPPDPAKLQEQLTAQQRENRELKVTHVVLEAARKSGADTDLLIPVLRHQGALDALDPASTTFAEDVTKLVKATVDKNPKLKAGLVAPRSGGEFPGGNPNSTVQQLTRADLKSMSAKEINDAREAGALDNLLAGG